MNAGSSRLISTLLALTAAIPGIGSALSGPAAAPPAVLVHIIVFQENANQHEVLEAHGIRTSTALDALPYALAGLSAAEVMALGRDPRVRMTGPNPPLTWLLDLAINATRVRDVHSGAVLTGGANPNGTGPGGDGPPGWENKTHPRATPNPLEGEGVGIAIVDSGVDCAHPDLERRCVPHRNLICLAPGAAVLQDPRLGSGIPPPGAGCRESPTADSSRTSHGTHVAGIALGDGTASAGRVRGVAPGASLYAYSLDESGGLWSALLAFDHILKNRTEVGHPPIRIVSNSWGVGAQFAPLLEEAVRALVAEGLVVVFAFGNGGDREDDDLSEELLDDDPNPICLFRNEAGTPLSGLVCVGNYHDGTTCCSRTTRNGTREGDVHPRSSRGFTGRPETWPDLVAPGSSILAARSRECRVWLAAGNPQELGPVPWDRCYQFDVGTSFAAPHVAGVAALMLQASPGLAPEDVEEILKHTAHPFEARAPYPNRHAGFGLVDALSAVQAAADSAGSQGR